MKATVFQSIFDKLQDYLPQQWDQIIYYALYMADSYSMKFYIRRGDEITDCFHLPGISRVRLAKTFMAMDKDITAARKELAQKDLWSVMTMVVDSQGNMKTDFDYTDISESSIEYVRQWEKKYL